MLTRRSFFRKSLGVLAASTLLPYTPRGALESPRDRLKKECLAAIHKWEKRTSRSVDKVRIAPTDSPVFWTDFGSYGYPRQCTDIYDTLDEAVANADLSKPLQLMTVTPGQVTKDPEGNILISGWCIELIQEVNV